MTSIFKTKMQDKLEAIDLPAIVDNGDTHEDMRVISDWLRAVAHVAWEADYSDDATDVLVHGVFEVDIEAAASHGPAAEVYTALSADWMSDDLEDEADRPSGIEIAWAAIAWSEELGYRLMSL